MFWSRPEVYGKYMNHADITSESSDDEEDADEKVSDNEEDTDGPVSDDEEDADDDEDANNEDGDDDDSDNLSQALSDQYYRYAVNDEVDAFWGGDETTMREWECAVIAGIDIVDDYADNGDENDKYDVIFDFNSERVS